MPTSRADPRICLDPIWAYAHTRLMQTDLLTADQAAIALGVNRRTVNRWATSGRLAVAHRSPGATGALLFSRSDVDALRHERRAELSAALNAMSAS